MILFLLHKRKVLTLKINGMWTHILSNCILNLLLNQNKYFNFDKAKGTSYNSKKFILIIKDISKLISFRKSYADKSYDSSTIPISIPMLTIIIIIKP